VSIAIAPNKIKKIVSGEPSTSGYYREVWLFGDIAIKRDDTSDGRINRMEFDNYQTFQDSMFSGEGGPIFIRFPETVMVGNYLIQKRITFRHLDDWDDCQEPVCVEAAQTCNTNKQWLAHEECKEGILLKEICRWMRNNYNIHDMHNLNFMWDDDTRTAWIIDFTN
jgi:hypothetical protein